ncbi:MAG: hypothetical protein IPK60_08085 [Sandaracinaceae bacterium]|nr:hypothetical protein [Sandaracinaceae bacterium]
MSDVGAAKAEAPSAPRIEDEKCCIDIRLSTSNQLFDNRDPSPFREGALDPEAVEYILARLHELPRRAPIRLVLWVEKRSESDLSDAAMTNAIPEHFRYEQRKLRLATRAYWRRGPIFFLVGIAVIVASPAVTLQLPRALKPGSLLTIITEGVSIISWVAVWRPLEALMYEWWPLRQQRRMIRRLLEAEVVVRHERGPASIPPPGW